MSKKRGSTRLLWELITVALGVFMALVVNNYSEHRKEQQRMQKVIAGLRQEVSQNKALVERSLEFHTDFLKDLSNNKEGLSLQLNMAPIISSAWETAQSSEVLHLLDYDLSVAFAEVYSWHEEYDKLRFLSDQALYFIRFSNQDYGGDYLGRWYSAFEDFRFTEQELLKRYNTVLSLINLEIE